jgi:hypothetical protein
VLALSTLKIKSCPTLSARVALGDHDTWFQGSHLISGRPPQKAFGEVQLPGCPNLLDLRA